jgi:hypothetical protein
MGRIEPPDMGFSQTYSLPEKSYTICYGCPVYSVLSVRFKMQVFDYQAFIGVHERSRV